MSRGVERLVADLNELGFEAQGAKDPNGAAFAVVSGYTVELGRFAGRVIDLGIPAPENYPEAFGSSIHVRTTPQLLEKNDSLPNVRNIVDSSLGPEWRYWSHNFGAGGDRTTRRLLSQVNLIFHHV